MKGTVRRMWAAFLILAAATAARAQAPAAGAPRATVNFGRALQYDEGIRPKVALNDNGQAVEVHQSQGHQTIWYHVGNASVFDVSWGPSIQYDDGESPSVALTNDGVVIEVHESENHVTLWYHVGRIVGDKINWGPSRKYDDGQEPSVAVNGKGQVVEVHKSQGASTLWYHVGTLQGDTIQWGPSRKYDDGVSPSVSINDQGQVIEVHQSQNHPSLWYHVGKLSGDQVSWGPSYQYDNGVTPSVALGNDGLAVEVHESQNHGTLWQRTGLIQPNGNVAWTGAVEYDDGAAPSVARNAGLLAIQVHPTATPLKYGLWCSTGLIADRSRWMEQTPALASKPLWKVTLPGTHDSGAYNMSTDRCPCRDLKFNIPGTNVVGDITRPYSEAQSADIAGQLAGGVRYFDIRPYDDGKSFRAYHDVIGADVSTMLDQTRAFLQSVNKELVILDFSHFCSPGGNGSKFRHAVFQDLIVQKLGPYLAKVAPNTILTSKFGDLVASGPRVLALYEDDSANGKQGEGLYITSNVNPTSPITIYNHYADTDSYGAMVKDQTTKMEQHQSTPQQMFLLSWTLTFQGAGDLKYGSLHGITHDASPSLGRFLAQNRQYNISILYVDFFADARPTDLSIVMNR